MPVLTAEEFHDQVLVEALRELMRGTPVREEDSSYAGQLAATAKQIADKMLTVRIVVDGGK